MSVERGEKISQSLYEGGRVARLQRYCGSSNRRDPLSGACGAYAAAVSVASAARSSIAAAPSGRLAGAAVSPVPAIPTDAVETRPLELRVAPLTATELLRFSTHW